MPDPLAGARIEAHERLAEEVVAVAMAAIIVIRRGAERQVHVAQLLVGAEQRPRVGPARRLPGVVLPGLVADLARAGHRAEGPHEPARPDVEPAHVPRGQPAGDRIVEDRRADDDHVAHDHWRRGVAVDPARDGGPAQPVHQVHRALVAEGLDRPAGLGVERDHRAVAREHDDALVLAVPPVGDAAVKPAVVRRHAELPRARIEQPLRLAGCRVDRGHLGERGARVEHAVDHDRRPLVEPARIDIGVRGAHGVVRRRPTPGDLEVAGVRRVDLVERRVPGARVRPRVRRPLAACQRCHRLGGRAG